MDSSRLNSMYKSHTERKDKKKNLFRETERLATASRQRTGRARDFSEVRHSGRAGRIPRVQASANNGPTVAFQRSGMSYPVQCRGRYLHAGIGERGDWSTCAWHLAMPVPCRWISQMPDAARSGNRLVL